MKSHAIWISHPRGTPGSSWLWNIWRGSKEPDHHNLNGPPGPADQGPAPSRHWTTQPTPACSSHGLGGPCAARTLLRARDSANNHHERFTSQLAAQNLQPTPPGPGGGHALHGPSRGPVTKTGPGADNTTSQDERPSGHPAGQDPKPTPGLTPQGPGGHPRCTDPPAAQ